MHVLRLDEDRLIAYHSSLENELTLPANTILIIEYFYRFFEKKGRLLGVKLFFL